MEACLILDGTGQDTVRYLHATQFTAEQEALAACYAFIEKEYIKWLKINHPEFHIKDDSSTETTDDPCEQPATSRDLRKHVIWCLIMCQAPPHHCLNFSVSCIK